MSAPLPTLRGVTRADELARAAYSEGAGIYRIVPAGVAIPADVRDIVHLVRWATHEGQALVPRGAGSAMGGGNVGDGIVVDLTRIEPELLEVRPDALAARTGAGITWGALHRAAGEHGLRLPPDPSSGRWATMGGIVSTNAAGARSVQYGPVRPWVRALELVTADGEHVRLERGRPAPAAATAVRRFEQEAAPRIRAAAERVRAAFPATRKNSSGYALDAWLASGDLLDLVIGAEGTLGIVTAVEWRLDRVPRAAAALRVALATLAQLPEAVTTILAHQPSAVELIDRTFLQLVGGGGEHALPDDAEAVLLVEFEGTDQHAARTRAGAAAAAVAPLALAVETALDDADIHRLWAVRHAASPTLARLPETRRSLQVVEDGCVPVAQLGEYVAAVRAITRRHGVEAILFGHAGDGHLHCNLLPDVTAEGWEARVAAVLDDVTAAQARLGGTASGEHGDGRLRAPLLGRLFGNEMVGLFAAVKRAFDPHGILNPGIKLGSAPPIARLKVGAEAAPLPRRIADGLRAIEREGGYAMPRLALLD